MTRRTLAMAALTPLMAMMVCGAGCAAPPMYTDHEVFLPEPRPLVGGKPYTIEPPDSIQIIAPGAPDLHQVGATLRPDGYITLYPLGEVFAAGKTPTQLAAEIEELGLEYYEDVRVQVKVTSFASKRYFMYGETSAGPRPYNGRDTVLDAVLSAGLPRTAWPERVVVIRPNEEGELIARMTINIRDMTERGDLRYNAVLEEGDIIFVPTNRIAQVGIFVQNLISPVDPVIRAVATPARVSAGMP